MSHEFFSFIGGTLKITGIVDSAGIKPAIDGGWDEIEDSNIGVQLFRLSGQSNENFILENIVLTHGYADYGGAIHYGSSQHFIMRNAVVEKNYAESFAGGVYISAAGNLDIIDTVISNNKAKSDDASSSIGGIYVQTALSVAVVNINNCIISENSAAKSSGIYAGGGGKTFIRNSKVSGNLCTQTNGANEFGCGMKLAGTVSIENSLIIKNKRWNNDNGGSFTSHEGTDIYIDGAVDITLKYVKQKVESQFNLDISLAAL